MKMDTLALLTLKQTDRIRAATENLCKIFCRAFKKKVMILR